MTIDSKPVPPIQKGKPLSRRLLCGASLAAVLACAPLSAHAEDRYWDANGTAVGSGGTGTWNLANLNWSPNGDGVSGPFAEPWNSGDLDDTIFGGTAGTVTVGVPVTVGNITFSSAGYVLSGSTITLGSANSTITTATGNSTINSVVAGSNGLIKAGGGGLILNGVNSFTGDININAGSLYALTDSALGAAGNNIFTASGITTRLSIGGASTARTVTIGNGGNLIVEGAAAGSARIRGNGSVQLAANGVTMSNDLSDYTGRTVFTACNGTCSTRFTSIGNLGEASSLGAPVTVLDGTIVFSQQSQYSDSIIYLGDGDSSNRNWDINGNAAVIRNQGTGTLSLTGDIDVSTGSTFIAETADVELLGILSGGNYAFNGAAGNIVTLAGANTFTGRASIGGLVRASVLADTGAVSSFGAGSVIALNTGTLSYSGTSSSSNRLWEVSGASGILNEGAGALDLSGSATFAVGGAADSLTLGGTFAGENQFSGVISGAGNLISNGSGTWVVGGANNFTGDVTVSSGTLKMGNAAAFGPTNGLVVNGGTLDLGGFDLVARSLTGAGGTVALGAQTMTVDAKTAQVFGGSITGTGGLRKNGAGSLTLTGTNLYTGTTTVGGGLLKLDFTGAGGSASNIISASSALVLSGGTLEVAGAAGETNNQSFNGLTVSAGSNTVRAVSGAGGIVNLNLSAIARAGGLVNFVLPTSGAITTSNADGVLGGWATINGSDYAKVVGGGIIAFDASDYTTKDDAATWANGNIISDTANAANTPFFGTVTGTVQLGGLRYTAAATANVAIGAGNTLGIDGTIIVAPSTGATNQNISGGSLTGSAGGGTLGVQHNGTGTLTIASTMVNNGGATSFAKSGSGIVRLTGTNSYTGGTTLSGGRLEVTQLANGGAASGIGASSADAANLVLESGTLAYTGGIDATTDRGITLVNGGAERAIQVDSGRTVEFSGLVTSSDDAGLTKTGWGTLVLSNAANDYTGVTTITQNPGAGSSTLSVNTLSDGGVASGIGAASSDSANLVLSNSARLQYTGGTVAIDRGFTLGGGQGGIDVANAGTTLTISGVAAGAGSLFKDGAGTLILSGANTYTGDTTVNSGILRAGSAQAFGPSGRLTVNSGTTLELGGFDASFSSIIGGGLIDLGGRTLTTGGAGGIFTGRITGTGGYRHNGGFTQTLSGCNNDYTGVTTVAGSLSIDCIANGGQVSGIGASSAAASSLVIASGGTLVYTGVSASTNRGFTVTGNGTINVFDAGTTLEFSGIVAGGAQLNKNGAGTLLLSGTNNSTGAVRVLNGTLRAGSTTAFGSGAASLDNTAGALLDLDGYNNSFAYLAGGGTLGGNITLDGATLTINAGSSLAAANFGGAISGNGGLIKNGGSIQQLSGCSSGYGGTTVINAGTLAVACLGDGGANSSIGSSSSAAGNLVLNGGTLQYVGTGDATNRQFTLGASATSKLDASGTGAIAFTHAGPLTFASANTAQTLTLGGTNTANNILAAQVTNNGTGLTRLTKNDTGTWVLTNAGSTYTGVTTINGGVLGVDKLANGGLASSIGASSAAASNLVIGNGSTLRYTGSGDTTNRLFTLSAGVTFIESSGTGAIVFTDTGPVTLASNNLARTIALGGSNAGDNTLAGSIGNAGTGLTTLAKNDSGTWVLTGNHSYTGSTNVNGGTLFIGGGGTTGSIASAIVNNFGTLGFNRSDLLSYGGQIGGTGSVRQAGTGTTVLTGTNLYTGGTTIDAGTLQLGGGGTTGSIVGDVVDNGLLVFNRSNLVTFAGTISGSGAVRQIGSGTTVLSGVNRYAGGTSILGGTLQVSADANLGAAAGTLDFSGGTLRTTASFASGRNTTLTGAGTILTDAGTIFSLNGLVSGAGGLTKSGTGILALTGSNSYAGATSVNAGTLLVNGNQSAATGLLTVASGATLGGSGTIGGSVNVLNGGIIAPGNSPGTLNINGDLSLAGGSVLNFEFGQADVAGGPLNDLIDVGGDLTLDGTINVNVSAGGNFGGGLYRVFNYGGALVDNGLTLGSIPAGSNVTVQTSVAGQVNLINSDGLSLSFWDGAGGPKFDNLVNGGNGSWHLGGADNNWTGADGSINAAYADGTFAIFAGAPGTVTVDNSGGTVTAAGMQFATGGYTINGAPLTLVGPDSVVRVGDGTAAGAGFTATIAASLAGASQLVKTDSGTLVLSGANSYTGGTAINGGTVQIANNANLGSAAGGISFDGGTLNTTATFTSNRAISVAGTGTINTNAGTSFITTSGVAGAGSLTKTGAGTLIITGDALHSGGTTIAQGTLSIGSGSTTGSIAGDIVNNGVLAFGRSATHSYGGSISGSGTVSQNDGILTLTGNSNYGGGTNVNLSQLRVTAGNTITSGGGLGVSQSGLTISGAGSTFEAASITGLSGTVAATIDVTNGGVLRATAGGLTLRKASPAGSAAANLNVSGPGSLVDLADGISAATTNVSVANIAISGGGTVRSGALNTIGALAGNPAASTVTITGAGSNWTSSGVFLLRNAQLSVLDGGAASFASAQIGTIAQGANALVSGAGSTFTTTGLLSVGSTTGNGVLTIADGALVTTGTGLSIAEDAGTTGAINIGGVEGGPAAAAGFLDGAITFGPGAGELNFNHTETGYLFATAMSGAGAMNHVAGTTRLTGDSSAFTGTTSVAGGTLLIDGILGGAASLVNVGAGGTLGGTGIIGGNVDIQGGNLNPGDIGGIPGRLTIAGNLSLAPASTLNLDFGEANVVGGAFNDLIEVGGDLTLDGTLNVSVTSGGSFDPGVYRVINYGGTLTDNGLTADPGYFVQTSVANQVNLVNTTGLTLRFWDGAAGAKNDGMITGGDGLWQASSGNDNWTEFDGSANAPFTDAAFAVFSALPGTVTVDGSLGAVTASGMQFANDGYVIGGDDIALVAPQSTIRVGDGTATGAGYTATIATKLTGVGQLIKTDLGTLVLTGSNSFAGGTRINAGTLSIASDANLGDAAGALGFDGGTLHTTADIASARDVVLIGSGALLTDAGTSLAFSGALIGAGDLIKDGAGILALGGTSNRSGTTTVRAGSLFVNCDQSAATGPTGVLLGATLGGTGIVGGDVSLADGATLAAGSGGVGTLTVNGNLALSAGSMLDFELGQANVAGGSLNDRVDVGGALVLDGTLNVAVPGGGSFGPGIYRLFNYGGALTDNGLALGAIPGGGVAVQTAIAGQVNLVNSAGLTLSFWDGTIGPKNNGAVNGGNGTWQIAGGLNNWTDAMGAVNADYAQGSFAIFSAAPGTVTVDNSGGNVLASGMQFASNGYVLTGDALTLTGMQATIQVGDNSAAGAGYTATIAAELTGTAGLIKTDAGTLVLTGTNSYAGGTLIDGGTLQIGNGGASGFVGGDILNNAALVVDRSGTILLDGAISGTGSLTKRGSGLLELTGTNSYAGGTLIDGGAVRVSSDAGLGNVAGVLSLQGGTLQAGASFTSTRGILLGSNDSNAIDVQGFDVTLGGVIGNGPNNGAGNFVDKRGTGTLTLTGANTYANRTVIAGGTLALAGAGTIGAGNLVVGAGTVFDISQTTTGARVIQLGGAADGTIALGSKTLTLGFGNSFTDWAGSITDGGIGGGAGGSVVIAAPNGAVRYFGATSYTGGTTVAAGSFELVGNGALYSQGAVTVNAGGRFNIAGIAAAGTTIGDLSGAGSAFLGGKVLTFGTANDTAFTGPITGAGGALAKQGAGTFTLGGANSYTGATDVLAGTLLVNGNQSAATGLTSVASGATLGGTGIIGGNVVVAGGATLAPGAGAPGALTINGNLTLASNATLGFEFGRANDVGGPLNDVVNVGGNLVLDGTLDVAVPVGGAFDIGLYRIANYAGSLTDNGLALGTMPVGANVQVQTAIAGEVNLINKGSATLNFWDGAVGPKFDNAVNGGDGVWQSSTGNDNWADITGAVNAGYDDGAFAIFSGTAGTVTIDNSLGAVSASGMQFATGGYRITGDALTLDGAQAVIRVGDGTAAGAAYVATIDAELTGAAGLVKTDAGTLVLTGSNSYTGGTSINGGTLQIGADGNLGGGAIRFDGGTLQTTATFTSARGVELIGTGGFNTGAGTTLTLAGALSGAGSFTKSGAGTLVLGGSGTYGGATVGGGTMFVNGNYAAATGMTTVLAGATLGGTGTIGGNVTLGNGAVIAPGAGAAGTLTIGGNLSLSATTQLDFEFGAAGVVGGALNDLVNVGGNLVLDGVINVGVPTGGAFDVGVYRMFNYGGALTNNGVTLGTLPTGANANVQTSIAGQVNLVNSAGLTLNFWDGAGGPKNNGVINGGNGVWQNSDGNDGWTGENGAINAAYSDGAFAIFGGTGGTVTVDNSLGAVSVAGMQFAANNYVITGGGIALTGATATIRVGDGSTAGAGFTATINSALGGAAQLVKSDAGTLVLGGTNSYTGGTQIVGGTLRISSDANLGVASGAVTLDGGTLEASASLTSARDVVVASGGTIATAADMVFTYNGLFSGTGALTKNGAGTLLVTANNSGFGGSTTVAGGTLAVQGSLGGAVSVGVAGRLEGAGRVGSIMNAGIVAPGSSIGSLTVTGDYAGNGGVLEIEAALGGDTSAADRLVVNGATSGNTRVTVINRGGLGAQTVEGIKIVDVAGASNGNFTLDGDYLFDGQQAVIAGAYGYRLYKNGVSTPQDGDWYLRSSRLDGSGNPEGPLYQPGVPVYEAYVGALQSLNRLPTLQQRVGNRSWAASPVAGAGLWGRFESERQRPDALVSTSGADRKVDQWQAQLGLDATLSQRGDGAALVGGLTAHYGKADSAVTSIFGDGSIDTQGYGVGATMTWYGPKGFYVDGQVKLSWFDSDLESNILGSLAQGNKGDGQAFSLELGKQTSIGRNLSITPQVQMSYAKVDFDRFAYPADAAVSAAKGDSLKTRWGVAIDHQTSWKGRSGDTRRTRLYSVINLSYEWLDGAVADVSGTPIINRDHRLSGQLGLGGSYSWGDDRFTLYTEVSGDTAIADFGAGYNLKGTAGFRVRF